MTAKISVDKAGRVVLPKPVRDALRLAPGDELTLESGAEQIILRPVRPQAPLKKELGIWVYQGQRSEVALGEWLDRERERRLRELAG